MRDEESWKTFEKTGSIVDYLNYKGIRDIGEEAVESDSDRDGDDTVRNTNR